MRRRPIRWPSATFTRCGCCRRGLRSTRWRNFVVVGAMGLPADQALQRRRSRQARRPARQQWRRADNRDARSARCIEGADQDAARRWWPMDGAQSGAVAGEVSRHEVRTRPAWLGCARRHHVVDPAAAAAPTTAPASRSNATISVISTRRATSPTGASSNCPSSFSPCSSSDSDQARLVACWAKPIARRS